MTSVSGKRAKILTIAASDSSSGAGHQADLRMAQALDCDCVIIQIALTAQSSHGVRATELTSVDMLEAQWQCLLDDGLPQAIKIGWLPDNAELLQWLLNKLNQYSGPVIWDPVKCATCGGLPTAIRDNQSLQALLRRADVITPNLVEARWLSGVRADVTEIVSQLKQRGAGHILLTGGDELKAEGNWVDDLFFPSPDRTLGQLQLPGRDLLPAFRMRHQRIPRQVHGTGCHLSSALACSIAQGFTLFDAVVRAVACACLAIRYASARDSAYDNAWAMALSSARADDWPLVLPLSTPSAASEFPRLENSLGLYALTDDLNHLQTLLALGVDTLQWRVKNPQGSYEQDTSHAIEISRAAGVPLFINDDWKLALKLGAYGVHLGQEDLLSADLDAIRQAGMKLGISTHSDWEIARARAIRPSYIAFGPVHPPLSKQLKYAPLGYRQLADWCRLFADEAELTCIGGITGDNIPQVKNTGMPSAAVVTDLYPGADLPQRHSRLRVVYAG